MLQKDSIIIFWGTPFSRTNKNINKIAKTREVTSENLIILTCFSLLSPHTTEATNQHRKAIIPTWKK